jgi:2-hydroxychromene-2-carboxylate isomerase
VQVTGSSVEFHFDFGSPNAYLAHLVIPDIEWRTGVVFEYVPILLGGVFKATSNACPAESMQSVPNKSAYAALETRRFIDRYSLADRYRWNDDFPVNTLRIMRGAVAARHLGSETYRGYVDTVFEAMWRYPRKMDEPEIINETLRGAGLPAGTLIAAMRDPQIKAELFRNTGNSVARGVFGAPSFFVADYLYFGKDRLREVEEAIVATLPARRPASACPA